MKIHTVKNNETSESIAALYDVDKSILERSNEIEDAEVTEGEQLLILKPTRTYNLRHTDEIGSLSQRFGLNQRDIEAANPFVFDKNVTKGTLALKSEARPYGMAATSGYYYKGTDIEKLRRALPYLTYLTFASVVMDEDGIRELFKTDDKVRLCVKEGVIPLVKVFDRRKNPEYSEEVAKGNFSRELIDFAKSRGFDGIALEIHANKELHEEVGGFLVELRKMMIGSDLILITEYDRTAPLSLVDYSDGAVFLSELSEKSDFDKDIKTRLEDFASATEGAKTFVELPSFGVCAGEAKSLSGITEAIRKNKKPICYDENSKLHFYTDRRGNTAYFPSLEYIKAILDLVREYGFMGISFDIGRTPISFILAYNSLYKTIKGFGTNR